MTRRNIFFSLNRDQEKMLKFLLAEVCVCGAIIVTLLLTKNDDKNEQEDYSYILDTTGANVFDATKKQIEKAEGVYIMMNGMDNVDDEIEEALKSGKKVGLIVNPTTYTYSSIYKTIDHIKEIVDTHKIELGVYYNIDKLMKPDTLRANVLLGEMFCLKLTANGIYSGFYGSDTNMAEYAEKYPEYIEDHSIDLFDKMIYSKDEQIDYNGIYFSTQEYETGIVTSQYQLEEIIANHKLNDSDNFIADFIHTVKSGENMTIISKKYQIKVSDLLSYNNLEADDIIYPGDQIIIPNRFSINDIVKENNEKEVTDETNQALSSLVKGIDVSHHQGTINWNKVAAQVDFAIVRLFDASKNSADEKALNNIIGCEKNDIPVGCYWFSRALTIEDAKVEAERVINDLNKYKKEIGISLEYPIFIDIEASSQLALNKKDLRKIIKAAAEVIEENGYTFGIYINSSNYNLVEGLGYPLWMTSGKTYNKKVDFDDFCDTSYPIVFETTEEKICWQYTQCGKIDGISGNVDLDYASTSLTENIQNSEEYKLQLKSN